MTVRVVVAGLEWVCFFAVDVEAHAAEEAVVLVELGLVEQRYAAVREVVDDAATLTGFAVTTGWRVRRCTRGCVAMPRRAGRVGGRVESAGDVSASDAPAGRGRIVELRGAHPGWGPVAIAEPPSATATATSSIDSVTTVS